MKSSLIGVIGCGGNIGRKLCERLVEKYYVRGGQRKKENIIQSNNFEWKMVDIFEKNSLEEFCDDCKIIINCAGPSYKIGAKIAIVADKMGVDYIDAFGGGFLEKEIVRNCLNRSNYKIFSAGSMPGFSGIIPRFLIEKYSTIDEFKIYEGSFEKSGIAASEDIILSSVNGFGLKDTFIENGVYTKDPMTQDAIIVPGVPDPVVCQYYLTEEIIHFQKKYAVPNLKFIHMSSNKEISRMLSNACTEAIFSDDNRIKTMAFEISNKMNLCVAYKKSWYAYIVEFITQHKHKRCIISAQESAEICAVIIDHIITLILDKKKNKGIYWAYDFADAADIINTLSEEKIIKYSLLDVADLEYDEGEL